MCCCSASSSVTPGDRSLDISSSPRCRSWSSLRNRVASFEHTLPIFTFLQTRQTRNDQAAGRGCERFGVSEPRIEASFGACGTSVVTTGRSECRSACHVGCREMRSWCLILFLAHGASLLEASEQRDDTRLGNEPAGSSGSRAFSSC